MICEKERVDDVIVDEAMKLIIMDDKIESKELSLFKEWKELEKTSKRKERCEKDFFKHKLDITMNIAKLYTEGILKYDSRITNC